MHSRREMHKLARIILIQMFKLPKKAASHTDEELLAAYRRDGDPVWLGYIFERYVAWVYGVCLNYYDTTAEAEDATMGVFEELHDKLRRHEINNLKSWLYTYAKNYCLMQLRSRQRAERREAAWQPGPTEEWDLAAEERDMQNRQLDDCIQQLPEGQKETILLFYYEEKSYQEIAQLNNQPLGQVRSFIQNGRRNLRICLENIGKQGDQV